jgi:cytochrome b involved in lipid metabolism
MKRAVIISMLLFWTIFVGIVSAGKVFQPESEGTNATPTQVSTANLAGITLSETEVAKHNNTSNCWIIFSGNVYDLTSYFGGHPGGNGTLAPYCGKDGSAALNGIHNHSGYANSLLASYLLGPLGKSFPAGTPAVTATTPGTKPAATTTAPANSNLTLTAAEVAKHNSSASCWVILSGGVYNLTSFKNSHSGGASTIPCGVDATSAIVSRHGSGYISLLASYRIGALGQAVSSTTATTTPTTPVTSPTGGSRENDD